jgi:hypothetical protein
VKEPHPTDLLSSLPRTRPHRRSAKRGGVPQGVPAAQSQAPRKPKPRRAQADAKRPPSRRKPAQPAGPRLRQPAQPGGSPAREAAAPPPAGRVPPSASDILGTAVGAVTELTEIGLTLSARALRRVVSRLPGA